MITFNSTKEEILQMAHPCKCPACENPCRFGSGALGEGDLQKLAQFFGTTQDEVKKRYLEDAKKFNTALLKPKVIRDKDMPYGKCVFFGEKDGCLVH